MREKFAARCYSADDRNHIGTRHGLAPASVGRGVPNPVGGWLHSIVSACTVSRRVPRPQLLWSGVISTKFDLKKEMK